jgi:colicin import membrane protein
MPRKLKTYVTSVGFFDKAIAAPSMKAALAAWGAGKNAFHQGFAEETDDPAIVAATMAKPGVVLKRAVGTQDPFDENAALPTSLPATAPKRGSKQKLKLVKNARTNKHKKSAEVVNLADRRAAKGAAAAYDREAAKRAREEKKQEETRKKERQRRDEVERQIKVAVEKAERHHEATMGSIAAERTALDKRAEKEDARWAKENKKFEADLKRTTRD